MGLRRDGGRAAGLRQRLADRVRDEAVHGAAVAEAHLMLGGMDVDVHRGGIDVQEQHIGRLAVAMQHVGVGGAQRVADRAVAHETAVDVQVLPVGARAGRGRAGDHAGQAHRADGMRQQQAVLGELRAQHVADALRRIGGQPLALRAVVVEQAERDVRMRQRDAFHRVHAMPEFGGFRAQELAARRHRVEQLAHVHGGAGRARGGLTCRLPPSICQACSPSRVREMMDTCATEAMEASASPRNPIDATDSSSVSERILLVAWRASASGSSSGGMPPPSSVTAMRRMPPPSSRTSMARAPASIAFSSTSLSTDAGRSMTSPAAI